MVMDFDIGQWQEPEAEAEVERSELDLSSDEENFAMEIDPMLLDDKEIDLESESDDSEWIDVKNGYLTDDQLEEVPSNMDQRPPDRFASLTEQDFMSLVATLRQQIPEQEFGEEGEAFANKLIRRWQQQRMLVSRA